MSRRGGGGGQRLHRRRSAARRKEAGLKVPDDLAVVGFDDSDVATLVEVPLTTVRQFAAEMGKAAARRLLETLRGNRGGVPSGWSCRPSSWSAHRPASTIRPVEPG